MQGVLLRCAVRTAPSVLFRLVWFLPSLLMWDLRAFYLLWKVSSGFCILQCVSQLFLIMTLSIPSLSPGRHAASLAYAGSCSRLCSVMEGTFTREGIIANTSWNGDIKSTYTHKKVWTVQILSHPIMCLETEVCNNNTLLNSLLWEMYSSWLSLYYTLVQGYLLLYCDRQPAETTLDSILENRTCLFQGTVWSGSWCATPAMACAT
jgi:hypothetical protein